jgi:hypothetical protein
LPLTEKKLITKDTFVPQQQASQDSYACTKAGDQVSICERLATTHMLVSKTA